MTGPSPVLSFLTRTDFRTNYYLATSNCYLSEIDVRTVQSQDLIQDSEWTLYENLDGSNCGSGGGGGGGGQNER